MGIYGVMEWFGVHKVKLVLNESYAVTSFNLHRQGSQRAATRCSRTRMDSLGALSSNQMLERCMAQNFHPTLFQQIPRTKNQVMWDDARWWKCGKNLRHLKCAEDASCGIGCVACRMARKDQIHEWTKGRQQLRIPGRQFGNLEGFAHFALPGWRWTSRKIDDQLWTNS